MAAVLVDFDDSENEANDGQEERKYDWEQSRISSWAVQWKRFESDGAHRQEAKFICQPSTKWWSWVLSSLWW